MLWGLRDSGFQGNWAFGMRTSRFGFPPLEVRGFIALRVLGYPNGSHDRIWALKQIRVLEAD